METLGVSYVLFQDLDFRYWGRCINEAGGNHHLIFRSLRGSFIGGADMYSDYTVRYGNGIQFWRGAHDNRVEYCLLTEVYDAALTAQGLGTYEADHIFFRNNIIMNSEYSFEYWQRDASSQAHDIFFENNTCINAGSGWGHSQRWDGVNGRHVMIYDNTAATSNVWIRNNIFSGATESAVWIYNPDDVSELMMDHNDYDAATVGRIGSSNYTTLADWQAASTRDAHSMAQPPLFVNAGAGDYRLQPGAPCIDKGTNASPSVDFDGVPRPLDGDYDGAALPDLGCFEFIHPLADSDADGLRDTNELAGVTSPVNPDCDDDRMNDGDETTAGTDPLDSGSVFALASSEPDAEGRLVLRWPSAAGRTYTLGQSTNLATGFSTLMEDLPASPPENTHTDTVSSLEFRLYRVKVRR